MNASGSPARTLLLVRHAKSAWDAGEDHERPLSGRGRRDAVALGEWLAEQDLRPDLVLCSTARRTRETWDRACRAGALDADLSDGAVRHLADLYHAWVPELLGVVRSVPAEARTVLVVGHSPGVPDLVAHLCRRTPAADWDRMETKFPTSGVAVVDVPGAWGDLGQGRAELRTFAVPRG